MAEDQRERGKDERGAAPGKRTPWLEWLAAGVGLLLVLVVFGSIGWQALGDATSPPDVVVETTGVARTGSGYRVMFRARNRGGAAAAQVRIDGILSGGDQMPETSSVILDYIPGQSAREGGLFFSRDPQAGVLAVRAAGFAKP